jgi:hypothetical protein
MAVSRLMESGDVETPSDDGAVRSARVEQAKLNSKDGAYNDQSVLAEIVDRLLHQWKI